MSRKKEIKARLKELNEEAAPLLEELRELAKKQRVRCLGFNGDQRGTQGGCGRSTQVSKLTYIQTHWYDSNTGSPNGGYYVAGEGQFICPKCGQRNRLWDRPDVVKVRHLFKDEELTYD